MKSLKNQDSGGLEALEQFFGHMPADCGMAFVVIQHPDPTRVGIMPELLQRITPMKVLQASDRLRVQPDCVYVIPPNKSLCLLSGVLLHSVWRDIPSLMRQNSQSD